MSLTAAAIRLMASKGMTAQDIADIAEAMEAPMPTLSPGALRTRQWRSRLEATGLSAEEWRVLSMRVIARDGGVCQYCGTAKGRMACDHITPLSQGGSSDEANLVCACHGCNGGKSGNTLEQWMGESKAAEWRYHRETSRDISHGRERDAQVVIPSLPSLRSEEVTEVPNGPSVDASTPADPEKPKTKPPKSQRGTRLPEDWEPSSEEFDLARSDGLTDEEIHRAALEFRNYWCSRSRDATKLSWRLTWHNRVLELAERKRRDGARLAARSALGGGGGRGVEDFASIVARRRGFASG